MKLYIATTSLNFDTIMSTESISPVSFYSLRRFGIQHIYDKVSLCLPNSILLLGFIPDFSINRKEYDHRAMIIEIDTEFYPIGYFKEVKNGVYQTSKTIYLSPQSSSIIFLKSEYSHFVAEFSEREAPASLSLCASLCGLIERVVE